MEIVVYDRIGDRLPFREPFRSANRAARPQCDGGQKKAKAAYEPADGREKAIVILMHCSQILAR